MSQIRKMKPQHKKQGLVTIETLDLLSIKYDILDNNTSNDEMRKKIRKANNYMKENNEPYALVVKKDTFDEYQIKYDETLKLEMTREDAIEILISKAKEKSVVVSTTGMASRELFELRERYNGDHSKDFLTVGSMGHASQIALGIALSRKDRDVYCIDGMVL